MGHRDENPEESSIILSQHEADTSRNFYDTQKLRVDYKKLTGDRVGKTSESICARGQAHGVLKNKHFSSNGSFDIVCNADMRLGKSGNTASFLRMVKA